VLNDVRPLGDSKGLVEIPGAAEDKMTWSGGAGVTKEKSGFWTHRKAFGQVRRGPNIQLLSFSLVTPLAMSPLVIMALRRSSVLHHPGFWSQGTN